MTTVIDLWINGYSNAGTKVKTAAIKSEVVRLNKAGSNYELVMRDGLWFIGKVVA